MTQMNGTSPDTVHSELLTEIARAAWRLGAKSDLVGLIGSWGDDAVNDDEILASLRRWNDAHQQGLYRTSQIDTDTAIRREICYALNTLGAPAELLGLLVRWGDLYDDAVTLAAVRSFNRTGSIFDDQHRAEEGEGRA